MKTAYICSPYRAENSADLDRNIKYAQEITKKAIDAGYAPITPHLYLTQCLNDWKDSEREAGMAICAELLGLCDVMFIGDKYGVSEGMKEEIELAKDYEIKTTVLSPEIYAKQEKMLHM